MIRLALSPFCFYFTLYGEAAQHLSRFRAALTPNLTLHAVAAECTRVLLLRIHNLILDFRPFFRKKRKNYSIRHDSSSRLTQASIWLKPNTILHFIVPKPAHEQCLAVSVKVGCEMYSNNNFCGSGVAKSPSTYPSSQGVNQASGCTDAVQYEQAQTGALP